MSLRLLLIPAVMLAAGPAWGLDSIKTSKALVSGNIQDINKYTIKIKRTGGQEEEVQVNEIEYIRLDGEPAQLNLVRSAINGGRYKDALDTLEKINVESLKIDVKQEIEYFRAVASARMALGGDGSVQEAGKLMTAFVTSHANSWRYLEACEVLGDLLVAINNYPMAQQKYGELEKAPWVDMKMKGGILKGRALQGEGKFDEANLAFDGVLKLAEGKTGELVEAQRHSATIGKSISMAQTGKPAEAAKMLEDVIAKAEGDQVELHAVAYNALGNCYRKAGNAKAALLAFLHVDVLYNSNANNHAEALSNLSELWKEVGNADRAAESEQVLKERYPSSKWAKK